MFWRWLAWWFSRRPPAYTILVGRSFASAAEAAASAQVQLNASPGWPIGIAASALCCEDPEGTRTVEWDVYVLLRS